MIKFRSLSTVADVAPADYGMALMGSRSAKPPGSDYLLQQIEGFWKKEYRYLHWFGLRDGMSVLDLGCGPGHFTERLAECLPEAKFTGVDSGSRMVAQARQRLNGRADIVEARAEATGLPSGSFDFILARLLFQHLREPVQVAEEAYRLLKPGGKLAATDVDDELFLLVEPRVPGLRRLLGHYGRAQASCGGNRHVGRQLVRLLRAAGFVELEFEALATHSDDAGIATCFPQFDPIPLRSLIESGHLSRLEYRWLRVVHQRHQRMANRLAVVLKFMACGTKPATSDVLS